MNPTNLRSPLLRTLHERGFIHQATDLEGLDRIVAAGPISAYIGFDLTAPSLHVGSLIQLMIMRHVKTHGHEAIVLFGDGTTRIGDPSDKNGARPIISRDAIDANMQGIKRVIDQVVGPARHVFNSTWLDQLSFMDFLQGPAREFTLNRMLTMDFVKRRLDANRPMTIMELCYSMVQGMDFVELSRRHGTRLQIGGSDQWSNIIAGMELARRMDGSKLFGLTTPLMTDEHGRKMGKTADGQAVWLSPESLSSLDLWQFWRNVPDAKVPQFLGLFTDIPTDEVRRLSALRGAEINEAKIALATNAVRIAHGATAAAIASETATEVFAGSGVSEGMATFEVDGGEFRTMTLATLAAACGIVESKGAARRLAVQGGLRVNDMQVRDADQTASTVMGLPGVVAAGRKRKVRIVAR